MNSKMKYQCILFNEYGWLSISSSINEYTHNANEEVINNIVNFVREIGFTVLHLEFSPIKGPEGNIEYLIHIATKEKPGEAIDVPAVVKMAHDSLDK